MMSGYVITVKLGDAPVCVVDGGKVYRNRRVAEWLAAGYQREYGREVTYGVVAAGGRAYRRATRGEAA